MLPRAVPARLTAVGKLYLAHAPDALVGADAMESQSAERLERDIALVKRRGYAENLGEWIEGLAVFAAPVFVHGRMIGAIATALPTQRLARVDKKVVIDQLISAAERAADRLAGKER